ncbi:MAG: nitroreductase family protein [Proteobacteria bacterium]|nr:nitroreductase family protein [Pseudomonadota bacterium]
MTWTTIDKDKCTECGLCRLRCPLCYYEKDGLTLSRANETCCNLCGHCVALCPAEAIVHHQLDMANFPETGRPVQFDTGDFIQFIRQRRSHRHFKDEPVPRQALETLLEACRYSPTGSNRQTVEVIVVQDRARIEMYSNHVVDHFEQTIPVIESRVEKLRAEGRAVDQITLSMMGMKETLGRIVAARRFGFEVIFHKAPAVLIFHAPETSSTPKDDCVIAVQTAMYAARTMGLETCWIGLFEFAANTYPPLVEALALPEGHRVYAVMIAGYPALKFLRMVDRKPIAARWE